jgi:hypothetical protein
MCWTALISKRSHNLKKKKKKKEAQAKGKKQVPKVNDDVDMDDPSSPVHKTSTAAGSSCNKMKLFWWQRTLLCMNVAIHKENYAAYEERKAIIHNQQSLLHEI